MGVIVSVAPGLGKTYLSNHPELFSDYKMIDHETANVKYDQKNPNWTEDFINDARELTEKYDFVFIPQQPAIMEKLNEKGLEWIRVVPEYEKIPEVIQGIRERDNSHVLVSGNYKTIDEFIAKMEVNLYRFFSDEALANPLHQPTELIKIQKGEWLSNYIEPLHERYVEPKKEPTPGDNGLF